MAATMRRIISVALCKPCHSRITVEMGGRWPQNKECAY